MAVRGGGKEEGAAEGGLPALGAAGVAGAGLRGTGCLWVLVVGAGAPLALGGWRDTALGAGHHCRATAGPTGLCRG